MPAVAEISGLRQVTGFTGAEAGLSRVFPLRSTSFGLLLPFTVMEFRGTGNGDILWTVVYLGDAGCG